MSASSSRALIPAGIRAGAHRVPELMHGIRGSVTKGLLIKENDPAIAVAGYFAPIVVYFVITR